MGKERLSSSPIHLQREFTALNRRIGRIEALSKALKTSNFAEFPRHDLNKLAGGAYIAEAEKLSRIGERLQDQTLPHLLGRRAEVAAEMVGLIAGRMERGTVGEVLFERAEQELVTLKGEIIPPPIPAIIPALAEAKPKEAEGQAFPSIKVVRHDVQQTAVAIDGRKPVVFYGGDPSQILLFLLRHPQQNISTKMLKDGARVESPSQVCRGINERLDPEKQKLITWGGPSKQNYHYRLNADVEPFELTESSTGNQQEKPAKVSSDEMVLPTAVTTDQEAHLEPPSPHELTTSNPPDGTVRHVAPAQHVLLRTPAAAPSTEGKPPPAPTEEQRLAQALQRAGVDLAYAVVNFISLNRIREIENMNSNPVDFLIKATPDIAYLQPLLAGVSVPNPPLSLRKSLVRSSMELVIRLWHNRHAGRSQKEHRIAEELTLIERKQRVGLVGFLTATSKQG